MIQEEGAYQLLQLLIELGHRRGAVLSGPLAVSTAADRATGCRHAWTEAGLDPEALQTYHDEYTLAGGYRMAQEALKQMPTPTAIFAANNFIAIGAYRAVADAGLQVPEDVAMVAVDDMPIQLVSDPSSPLSPSPPMKWVRETQILLARLSGDAQAECKEVVLPFE